MSRISVVFAAALLVISMTGCALISDGGQKGTPTITSVSPSSAPAGSQGLSITISGSSLTSGLVLLVNGVPHTTTLVNRNQMRAALTATDLSNPGMLQLTLQPTTSTGSGGNGGGNPHNLSTLSTQTTSATTNTSTDIVNFTVTVPSPLAMTPVTLAGATQSSSYNAPVPVTGGVAPYTWTISSGSLPSGLSIGSSTGTISGVPTASGSYSFSVQVKDSSAGPSTASESLSIQVTAQTPMQVTTSSLPTPQIQVAYSASLQATGGTAPYSWGIASGSLPAGLAMNSSSGTISGTPTTAGTYTFTVSATSASPSTQSAMAVFTETLAQPNTTPSLQITTTSLPSGQLQSTYSGSVTATGGTAPYTWRVLSGALPGGVALDPNSGSLSGSPTAGGSFSFTVQAQDSSATVQTANQPLSINIGSSGGQDWPVHAGGNLQNAINSASLGDTVTLDAGATFTAGGYFLPAKSGCNGTSFVTIRSSAFATLPAGRIHPSDAPNLAKIVTNDNANSNATFTLANGAGCYQLVGLELTSNTTIQMQVMLQLSGGSHVVVDRCFIHPLEYPNITAPYTTTSRIAVQANSTDVTVENSYIDGFWGLPPGATPGATAVDSDGVLIDNGPCNPCSITNNYISAWFNNIYLGGSDPVASFTATVSGTPTLTSATLSTVQGLTVGMPIAIMLPQNTAYCINGISAVHACWGNGVVQSIAGNTVTYTPLVGLSYAGGGPRMLIPSTVVPLSGAASGAQWAGGNVQSITISRNYMTKPMAFSQWQLANNGNHPKGIMEVKMVDGMDMWGNVTDGFPSVIALIGVNQNGGAPWVRINNVNIHENWINGYSSNCFIMDSDEGYYLNADGDNWRLVNNICSNPDNSGQFVPTTSPVSFSMTNGKTVLIQHNTFLGGYAGGIYNCPVGLMPNGDCYIAKNGDWNNLTTNSTPNVTMKDNIMPNGNYGITCDMGALMPMCWPSYSEANDLFVQNVPNPSTDLTSLFPNSRKVNSWSGVLFSDPVHGNWSLQATSPGYRAGSDGTDVGVNWQILSAAIGGVIN